ncbi:MAG: hypothetical protein AB7U87_05030 [Candidatus Bipolaricaulis sp.]
MIRQKKILLTGVLALVAGLATAFVVLGQTTDAQTVAATATRPDLWAKVAANLGITKDALRAAFDQAEVEMIDAALAAGTITEDQAREMKARIETRRALDAVLDQAVADGKITQEQLDLLGGCTGLGRARAGGFASHGRGGGGPGLMGR